MTLSGRFMKQYQNGLYTKTPKEPSFFNKEAVMKFIAEENDSKVVNSEIESLIKAQKKELQTAIAPINKAGC